MEQVIYGDVYLIVNFTMDYLALYLTAKAVKHPPTPLRLAIGASLGAIYSLAALFLPDENPLSLFTAFAIPILLILAALGWQGSIRAMLTPLAAFWVISFLLGGAATAVSYLVGKWANREALIGGQVEQLPGDLPYWSVLLVALLAGAVVSFLLRGRKKLPSTVTLTIGEDGATVATLTGLVDSGNLLTEPISGRAVILVDRKSADFLPPELAFLPTGAPPTLTPRLRLIPYSTPSGEGILYGYLPKRVTVNGKERSACVAIADLPQGDSQNGKGKTEAIVPASLL